MPRSQTLHACQRTARRPRPRSTFRLARAFHFSLAGPTHQSPLARSASNDHRKVCETHLMLAELPAGVRPRGRGRQTESRDTTRARAASLGRGQAPQRAQSSRNRSETARPDFSISRRRRRPRRSRGRRSTSGHALPLPDDEARDATACCLRAPIRVRVYPSPYNSLHRSSV